MFDTAQECEPEPEAERPRPPLPLERAHLVRRSEDGRIAHYEPPDTRLTVEAILDSCGRIDTITWVIFFVSGLTALLRPDPTMFICLFGFYGADVASKSALRFYWWFVLFSIAFDVGWLLLRDYVPEPPLSAGHFFPPWTWNMFEGGDAELLERIAVGLTIVNDTIKLAVVYEGIRAHMLFWRREMILSEPMSPEAAAVAYEEARAATAEAEEAERARRREEGGDGGPEADEAERGTSGAGGKWTAEQRRREQQQEQRRRRRRQRRRPRGSSRRLLRDCRRRRPRLRAARVREREPRRERARI